MIKRLSVSDLVADLRLLGVKEGDTLYVRAKAAAVGRTEGGGLFAALIAAVGSQGTVVLPAFTGYGSRWGGNKQAFSRETPTTSGALSKLALQHPQAVRSAHPSNSFVAIGANAQGLLSDHDHTKPAFHPVGGLISSKAKMIVIGCNVESPGFSTVHYAQEQLGLSYRHLTKYLSSVQIDVDGKHIEWRPREDPGCSMGFDKLYRHYMRAEVLRTGWVGNAFSLLGASDELYKVDREVLSADPLAVLCDDGSCVSCRVLRGYNISAMPLAILRKAVAKLRRASLKP